MSKQSRSYQSSQFLRGFSNESQDVDIDVGRINLRTGVLDAVGGEEKSDGLRYLDGNRITAFNMKEEKQDGEFDEDWNYIVNPKERREQQMDAWLDDYEEKHGNIPYQVSFVIVLHSLYSYFLLSSPLQNSGQLEISIDQLLITKKLWEAKAQIHLQKNILMRRINLMMEVLTLNLTRKVKRMILDSENGDRSYMISMTTMN